MHKGFVFTSILLCACSTAPAQPPQQGETPGQACTTEDTDQFIGQSRSDDLEAAIKRVSHSTVVRWAPTGAMLTMDYSANRVTVRLDAANKVIELKCG